MMGFRHAFKGNRRYANRASRDGGTYMMMERSDKVVTDIEVTKLVTATATSRRMIGNRLECDLLTLCDLYRVCVMQAYIHVVQANINMYSTAYAIDSGMESEPPIGMQAEFVTFERIVASTGRSTTEHKHATKATMHCSLVNPYDWNVLYTKHRNRSTAVNIVNAFDIEIEDIKMTPATLQITDDFQIRVIYGTFPWYT